ncbi:MAG: 50S ribosomal protein L29 [Planctomycetota bacterium]|nr:MAG: 50S ribosomal protein L29 [Planctomycetota bacterium]
MKATEVHKLSDEEIDVEVARLRKRSFELRTQAVTEKIEDTSQFASTRADIARLLTERNARRIKVRDEIAGKRTEALS